MAHLELDVSVEGSDDLLRPLVEAMRSLEQFPELPLQVFRDLIADSLLDLSVGVDSAAFSAGDFRVVVQAGRRVELVTAALSALQSYLHGLLLCENSCVRSGR